MTALWKLTTSLAGGEAMPNRVDALTAELSLQNATAVQEQRFYLLRFMWCTIAILEKYHPPKEDIEELRGLYQGLAEGFDFESVLGTKKGADHESQPLF